MIPLGSYAALSSLEGYNAVRGVSSNYDNCNYTLAGLVAEICERADLDYTKYDVSKLNGFVTGFQMTNAYPAFTAVRSLSEMFFFDPSNYDGKLHFIPRGGDSVLTIDPDHLLDDSADEIKKRDGVIPRVMHLEYYDLAGQLEPDKQSSDRSVYIRENSEATLSTAVVLTADDARRIITVIHKTTIEEQRGEIHFSVPEDYIALTVGDIVTFNNDRLRIFDCQLDDGFQVYKAAFDRKSAYFSFINGIAPNVPAEINLVPGETTMQFLDIPILQSVDDELGYYFAIAGASDAWKGAQIEFSTDGGANYLSSAITTDYAIMGTLLTAMGDHSADVPDYQNTIQVQLITPGVELEPATLAEMLNRKNRAIIGNEIVCFGSPVEITEGVWQIDTFLRGRLHTNAVAHSIGERFVLLETDWVPFVNAEVYNLGDDFTFRATTLNSSTQTTITETYSGKSQLEPPPGYLRAHRVGSNIVIEWIGTGVKGGKTSVQMSKYFIGYRVTVNAVVTDTANETLTVADPGGAVTITVQQLNSLTGAGQSAQVVL